MRGTTPGTIATTAEPPATTADGETEGGPATAVADPTEAIRAAEPHGDTPSSYGQRTAVGSAAATEAGTGLQGVTDQGTAGPRI